MQNFEQKLWIKILTPTHVGGAQEKHYQENVDYIQIDNKWYFLDEQKVQKSIPPHQLANTLAKGDMSQLQWLMRSFINQVGTPLEKKPSDTGEVKALIRNGFGKVYLPGSSIKGTIKSEVLAWLMGDKIEEAKGKKNNELMQSSFGKMDQDFFRLLRISDSSELQFSWFPTKTFNLHKSEEGEWEGGWKHGLGGGTNNKFKSSGFVTTYESYHPDAIAEISFKCATGFYNQFKNQKPVLSTFEKVFNTSKPLDSLYAILNEQSLKHVQKELNFFRAYSETDKVLKVIEELEKIERIIQSAGSTYAVLRMAAGSGFHAISGDWQFRDHIKTGVWNEEDAKKYGLSGRQKRDYLGNYKKFKSRKIAFSPDQEHFYPMGFVMLSKEKPESPSAQVSAKPLSIVEEEPKSIEPTFFEGNLNKNCILDAVVIKALPQRRSEVEVYLNKPNKKKVIMLGYNEPEEGAIVQVGLERHPGNNGENIKEVHFKKFKK